MDGKNARLAVIGVVIVGAVAAGFFFLSDVDTPQAGPMREGNSDSMLTDIAPTGQNEKSGSMKTSSELEFQNIEFTEIGTNSATVSFETNKPVQCAVDFGKKGQGFTRTATDVQEQMSMEHKHHTVKLTGLEPDTDYQYRLRSISEGMQESSQVQTFSTSPAA